MKSRIFFINFLIICFVVLASAQPGDLDNGFATGGIFTTTLGAGFTENNSAKAVAVQNNGKIIFAGNTGHEAAIARLDQNGILDPEFGTDGKTLTDLGFFKNIIHDIALRPDGKIMALGESYAYQSNTDTLWLARYHSNGELDTNFGQGGIVIVDSGFRIHSPETIEVLPDGKIVIAGSGKEGSSPWTGFVGRFLENGEPDNGFGHEGFKEIKYSDESNFLNHLKILDDGKMLVAGSDIQNPTFNAAMARLNSDGTMDNTFGTDGVVITEFPDEHQGIYSLEIQPDGKIVATGFSDDGTIIWRHHENGILDTDYGTNGIVNIAVEGSRIDSPTSVLQPDGKLLIAGYTGEILGDPDIARLSRFTAEGDFDIEFGNGGTVMTDIVQDEPERINQIALQADGKILAVGYAATQFGANFTVLRYLSGLDVGTVDFTVSNNQVFIYPNPILEFSTIKYTLSKPETVSISLYSIDGKHLHSFFEKEHKAQGEQTETLLWPDTVPSGSYVLTLSNSNGQIGVKVFKQ